MIIKIIGLGPGDASQRTLAAQQTITGATELYLRTRHIPGLSDISAAIHSFDDWPAQPDAARRIAAEVVRLGQRPQGVVYAVPGHPGLAEATTPHILALAEAAGVPVEIIPGLSGIEPLLTALGLPGAPHLQLLDALELAGLHHPPLEPDRPALLCHLAGPELAGQVSRCLQNAYPAGHRAHLVRLDAPAPELLPPCPLAQLADHTPPGVRLALYLPADTRHNFAALQETIAHLRAPDGCPWDREQTHRSLRPYLLEETYEVLEALDAGDSAALAEELGDLLLQIVLHTQIAVEHGEFQMGDVIDHINRKLLRRHPHVFADVVVNSVDDVTTNWEAIKKAEKAANGQQPQAISALDGVPAALPALAQALTISKKAVKVGFEWPNIEGVVEKVIEEAHEIVAATDPEHLESEIGDLLFSVVNLARWRGIDPEAALRSTNARFTRRFKGIEALAAARGQSLVELSIEEMDELWEQVKAGG
ncbi:MAG: nucleoside triphosphate pyrophosphohydrolase [Anaerolineae bacterium]